MKKVLFSAAVIATVVLTSCAKKEHTCTCTNTYTYAGSSSSSTSSVTYKDVTKKNAKTLCVSSTQTDSSGGTTTSECDLSN